MTRHTLLVVVASAIVLAGPLASSRATEKGGASDGKAPATAPAASEVRQVTTEEFDKLRVEKDTVVLDVRTGFEFKAGHVPAAVNLPVAGAGSDAFPQQAAALDEDKTYVVYCAAGTRSAKAVGQLKQMGFKHLVEYPGGMNEWRKAGKPVEKGEGK